MKLLPTIIALLIFAVLCSCSDNGHADPVLDRADTLMYAAPDSAVAMLDSLSGLRLSADRRARLALLLAKAHEKAGTVAADSASLAAITAAADYYRGRGDSLDVQSQFYRGVLLGYRREWTAALLALMDAADRASSLGDNFYLAMAYREQADIYSYLFVEKKRADMSELAARHFLLAGKPFFAIRERMMHAHSLIRIDEPERAKEILADVKCDSLWRDDLYAAFYHKLMADAEYKSRNFADALTHMDSLAFYAGGLSSIDMSNKAKMAVAIGRTDLADEYIDKAWDRVRTRNDSNNVMFAQSKVYAAEGLYREAYTSFMKYFTEDTKNHNYLLTHPYTSLLVEHFNDKSKSYRAQYSETRNLAYWLGAICALLISTVVCLIIIYRIRIKIKDERADALLSDLSRFRSEVADLQSKIGASESQTKLKRLFDSQFQQLSNEVFEIIASSSDSSGSYQSVARQILKLTERLQQPEFYSAIEAYIDSIHCNLMSRFKEQSAPMTTKKYNAVALVFAGFSNQFMSVALGYGNVSSARSQRTRLKSEIALSDMPDKEEFLSYF